jgi:glutathione S-transferase
MIMKLYYAPGACSMAAHITAVEGRLKLELEKVDLKSHTTETGQDFRKINPKGYVPALGLDDGSLLTENGAILPYLGDKAGSMPDGAARYRALEWIAYINSELHKGFGPLFGGAEGDARAKAKERIIMRLKFMEERMSGDYLMGDRFSPPDAYLYVVLRWCEGMDVSLSGLPRLTAFKARMDSRPGVKQALKEEGLS